MIKVTVGRNGGFCYGVKRAIELAKKEAAKGKVYTTGPLIHNGLVIKSLESEGIFSEEDMSFLKGAERVVIRAHGIPLAEEKMLRESCGEVVDGTCPFVKKIHGLVAKYSAAGYKILIAGDASHPEVKGILSYAGSDAEVVDENFDFSALTHDKVCMVAQTTFSAEKYLKIKQKLQKNINNNIKSVEIFNTICYTTLARQREADFLARKNDFVIVLGSSQSSNSVKLLEIARKHAPSVLIGTSAELGSVDYNKFTSMAVLAAASTPQELIEEVLIYMSETQDAKVVMAEEQAAAPAVDENSMEALLASDKAAKFVSYKAGKKVKAKIISANDNGIYVNIGGKSDGFIDKSEATLDGNYNPADFKEGDEIEAIIIPNSSSDKSCVALSKKEVDKKKLEDQEAEKALSSSEFTLENTQVVKGGLLGKLGTYTIFVPASQIRIGFVKNLEDYTGKKLRLRALPPKEPKEGEEEKKRNPKLIIASQRVILEEEKAAKEEAFWSQMQVGNIVQGKVKRFSSFGAFVSVKGFDCLAHISDLSWNKITDPSKVLTINETYDFVILKVDRENGKISLGYKQLQKKPYELAAEKYPVGSIIKGKVERIFSFGAFISIDEGVDGLVHVSQISHKWTKDANEVLKVGDEVEAKIIGFEDNRITLSIKELLPEPEEEAAEAADSAEAEVSEKPKRAPRAKKIMDYSEAQAKSEENKQRKAKKDASNEPKEYISGTGFATLGDIFGSLDLKFDDEDKK